MESVFSFSCVNGVIDHSGNCNISIKKMKALLKVCCVRAEMHLYYFIAQNLLRDNYLSNVHIAPYRICDTWMSKMKSFEEKPFLKLEVLLFSFGPLGAVLYITVLLKIKDS